MVYTRLRWWFLRFISGILHTNYNFYLPWARFSSLTLLTILWYFLSRYYSTAVLLPNYNPKFTLELRISIYFFILSTQCLIPSEIYSKLSFNFYILVHLLKEFIPIKDIAVFMELLIKNSFIVLFTFVEVYKKDNWEMNDCLCY
jgi:hypothetical protein